MRDAGNTRVRNEAQRNAGNKMEGGAEGAFLHFLGWVRIPEGHASRIRAFPASRILVRGCPAFQFRISKGFALTILEPQAVRALPSVAYIHNRETNDPLSGACQ